MSVEVLIFGSLAVLLAAFTMSITGFGFALIAAPLLLFLVESKTVVIIDIVLGTVICILILWESRQHVRPKRVVLLVIGSVLGVPVGAYILSHTTTLTLKLVITALVIVFAIPLALGHSHRFKRERLICGASGFASGVLASSTSLAGPPVVLFLLNQGWEKETLRASLAAYFLFAGLAALTALGASGALSGELVVGALAYVPAVLLGFFLGRKVLPRLNAELFRRIAVLVVVVAGLLGIITSLPALL